LTEKENLYKAMIKAMDDGKEMSVIKPFKDAIEKLEKEERKVANEFLNSPDIPQKKIEIVLFGVTIFKKIVTVDEDAFYKRMSGRFQDDMDRMILEEKKRQQRQ
jgi:hypothetical protein